MGGERGWDAAESCFCCANDVGLSEEGDKRKKRKPKASRPARTRVMGFVRRKDLDMDMVRDVQAAESLGRAIWSVPGFLNTCVFARDWAMSQSDHTYWSDPGERIV